MKPNELIEDNMNRIKNKLAVMSGKGGVGKTTVAVNLAASLAKSHKVALLDADIDCPNVNRMLGIKGKFTVKNEKIIPIKKYKINVVSVASLQEKEDEPIIWRGPMLSKAVMQLLGQVEWGDLDYLIVDLPPGTSDAPLTIMQVLKLTGMIVVTAPQDVATIDARKSVNMARELDVPVLGIVENMSGDVFGKGGGEKTAKKLGVDFLGRLGLDAKIVKSGERGKPFIFTKSKSTVEFEKIVEKIIKVKK